MTCRSAISVISENARVACLQQPYRSGYCIEGPQRLACALPGQVPYRLRSTYPRKTSVPPPAEAEPVTPVLLASGPDLQAQPFAISDTVGDRLWLELADPADRQHGVRVACAVTHIVTHNVRKPGSTTSNDVALPRAPQPFVLQQKIKRENAESPASARLPVFAVGAQGGTRTPTTEAATTSR